MTPVEHGWEARYLRASRAAHRAWVASQPQYVIPRLLDGLDEPHAGAVRLVEPAATPSFPVEVGSTQTTGPGRMSSRDTRGRGHWR